MERVTSHLQGQLSGERAGRPPTSLFALARRAQSVHPISACRLFLFVLPSGPTPVQGQLCVKIGAPPRVSREEESWKRQARLGCDCHPGAGARESEKERRRGRVGEGGGGGRAEEERGAVEERRALGRGEGSASERERSRGGTGRGRYAPGGRVGCGRPEAPASPPPPTTPREGGASRAHKASESSISNLASWQDLCKAKSRAPRCKERGGVGGEKA